MAPSARRTLPGITLLALAIAGCSSAQTTLSQSCSADGFCWELPLPSGQVLNGLYHDGQSGWAVGGGGQILRDSGAGWSLWQSPTSSALNDLSGTSAADLWAVGDGGTILHFDGAQWTSQRSGISQDLKTVWAARAEDVWAWDATGLAYHFDGHGWSSGAFPAVGSASLPDSGTVEVSAVGPGLAFAVGPLGESSQALLRYDGSAWSLVGPNIYGTVALLALAADEVYLSDGASVARFDGQAVSPVLAAGALGGSSTIQALGGAPDGAVVFATEDGRSYRLDGGVPSIVGADDPAPSVSRLVGQGGALWSVGQGGVLRRGDGHTWTQQLGAVPGQDASITQIAGRGSADIWMTGDRGQLRHFDGQAWSRVDVGTSEDLLALYVSPSDATVVVAGRHGTVLRYDGHAWQRLPSNWNFAIDLQAVSVIDGEIWAAGESSEQGNSQLGGYYLSSFDEATQAWRPQVADPGTTTYAGLSGSWLIAMQSASTMTCMAYQRVNGAWQPRPYPVSGVCADTLWSNNDNDVWFAGFDAGFHAALMHFDGQSMSLSYPQAGLLSAVHGDGAGGVAITDDAGLVLLRRDGAWQSLRSGLSEPLNAVYAPAGGPVRVAGDYGKLLRLDR